MLEESQIKKLLRDSEIQSKNLAVDKPLQDIV